MNQDADDAGASDREALNSDLEGDPEDDKMVSTITVEEQLKAESNGSSDNAAPNGQGKLSAKDPQRPRRKKARRACHACQRAHLTCGMFTLNWSYYLSYMV
jgi:transcription activator of gluconeogenesis